MKRPSLTPIPTEMEPHFGQNRTRREVDPELEVLTLIPVEDEYSEAYIVVERMVSAGATTLLAPLM